MAVTRYCKLGCLGSGWFLTILLLRNTTAHWSGSQPPGYLPLEEDYEKFRDLTAMQWPCGCNPGWRIL